MPNNSTYRVIQLKSSLQEENSTSFCCTATGKFIPPTLVVLLAGETRSIAAINIHKWATKIVERKNQTSEILTATPVKDEIRCKISNTKKKTVKYEMTASNSG